MASRIDTTTVDARDPYALSAWWAAVLDYRRDPDVPDEPGSEEYLLMSADGAHRILFIEAPDVKSVKNRVHFDLRPTDRIRDEEVVRVLGLGATQIDDQRSPEGAGWVVLADPEGNEFCIVRSDSER